MPSRPELRLDWCSHEAARYAVENWHYSERMPVGAMNRIGCWESGSFIGCILFARGANCEIGSPYGLKQTEACELVRVALREHGNPVSRIIAIAMKFLRSRSPGLRLVVSYADIAAGHHGGIYQASNWIYVGKVGSRPKYIAPDGRELHAREVSVSGVNPAYGKVRRVVRIADCKQLQQPPKHKYLMPLDDDMRAKVLPLAKPYPKRAGSIASDVPAPQAGKGGATPTPALSLSHGGAA